MVAICEHPSARHEVGNQVSAPQLGLYSKRSPFLPHVFQVSQESATSLDGTSVPYFLVQRAGTSEPVPTLLYGYGGFGVRRAPCPLTPSSCPPAPRYARPALFMPAPLPFLHIFPPCQPRPCSLDTAGSGYAARLTPPTRGISSPSPPVCPTPPPPRSLHPAPLYIFS